MPPETDPPKLIGSVEVVSESGAREVILVKRLSNTDMIRWIQVGFDHAFLVFRSVERADKTAPANQAWFDSLTGESALAVVEQALTLNHAPAQKKIIAAAQANLASWLSATPSSSSPPAATASPT